MHPPISRARMYWIPIFFHISTELGMFDLEPEGLVKKNLLTPSQWFTMGHNDGLWIIARARMYRMG